MLEFTRNIFTKIGLTLLPLGKMQSRIYWGGTRQFVIPEEVLELTINSFHNWVVNFGAGYFGGGERQFVIPCEALELTRNSFHNC